MQCLLETNGSPATSSPRAPACPYVYIHIQFQFQFVYSQPIRIEAVREQDRMSVCIHTYICRYTHTHTHAHTHKPKASRKSVSPSTYTCTPNNLLTPPRVSYSAYLVPAPAELATSRPCRSNHRGHHVVTIMRSSPSVITITPPPRHAIITITPPPRHAVITITPQLRACAD